MRKKRNRSHTRSPPLSKRPAPGITVATRSRSTSRASPAHPSAPHQSLAPISPGPATTGPSLGSLSPAPSSSSAPPPVSVQSSFATPNPFGVLRADVNTSEATNNPKPPPIYIKGVIDFSQFARKLSDIIGPKQFICKARINDVAVFPVSSDAYRKAIHWFKESQLEFHTYQLKEEKSFRVVIRHIHPSTSPEAIKTELGELGFKTRSVTNVHHAVSKTPLALFFADLEPAENNKDIFQLTELCFSKIKVEEPHKKQQLVQCKNCQKYGHTRSYCHYIARCVKCTGNHQTVDCKKTVNDPVKCVNCQGSHPANYRGCVVHKELQNRRKAGQQPTKQLPPPNRNHLSPEPPKDLFQGPPLPTSHSRRHDFSQNHLPSTPSTLPQYQPSSTPSYAAVASSRPENGHCHPHTPSSSPTDLTNILTSFLNDLKSTIQPLISLLTNVLTSLVPVLAQQK